MHKLRKGILDDRKSHVRIYHLLVLDTPSQQKHSLEMQVVYPKLRGDVSINALTGKLKHKEVYTLISLSNVHSIITL